MKVIAQVFVLLLVIASSVSYAQTCETATRLLAPKSNEFFELSDGGGIKIREGVPFEEVKTSGGKIMLRFKSWEGETSSAIISPSLVCRCGDQRLCPNNNCSIEKINNAYYCMGTCRKADGTSCPNCKFFEEVTTDP